MMKYFNNYHRINTSDKIEHDSLYLLEKTLNGYAGYDVVINNTKQTKVLMYQRYDSDGESMKVIGRVEDIERGNLIEHDDNVWLVVTKPEDNRIYRKAQIHLCSTTFPIKDADQEVVVGYDRLNRPIYETIKGQIEYVPCLVEMNNASVAIADSNRPINNLDNKVVVTIPYRESPSIAHDATFHLYDMNYRIIRIDPSKSINGVGILRITGEMTGRYEGDDSNGQP